jgi:hypothetical protein
MTRHRRAAIWMIALAAAAVIVTGVIVVRFYPRKPRTIQLAGAVIRQSADPRNQTPIENAVIGVAGTAVGTVKSDFSGAFRITLPRGVAPGEPVTLTFRQPDYKPLDMQENITDQLYIARMMPLHEDSESEAGAAATVLANTMVRYTTEITTTENVGTGVRTFQVENSGNVPCDKHPPCSPDGKWKAAVGSASLDAGAGNEFTDARVTCIAGPCAFTKIESDGFSHGGRTIRVSILDWSDTTTFLLQAEVFRPQVGNVIRQLYPVIFGRAMNFTLPNTAEGPSIEAEVNGTRIVFPLGPAPMLSWADCDVRVERNQAKDYRCVLKAGFRFK